MLTVCELVTVGVAPSSKWTIDLRMVARSQAWLSIYLTANVDNIAVQVFTV